MITDTDLSISNTSYTNKDFESVYTELQDICKKISDRYNNYDASDSNESDPFIVLLKLMSFVTDKVNYNVDKNILEQFLPSATQERSVRELCARQGYAMHYYQSATTKVLFKYNDNTYIEDITIPQFTKITTDEENGTVYTTLESTVIDSTTHYSTSVNAIQGELQTLSVLDSTSIKLENLDDNNRIYFPSSNIAENGVIINNINEWEKVDNLNVQEYNSKVYSIAYDSEKSLPYIQFPEWINNLIGDGLSIQYFNTLGKSGNVSARALTKATNLTFDDSNISSDNVSVINSSSAINGLDPETINEAYNGFKKTIGTFDTLVSCRDYANYIYNNLSSLASNVQVADRRTDINYGCDVVTFTSSDAQVVSVPSDNISGNDLCIYPLTPINDYSFSTNYYITNYNNSYAPALNKTESGKYSISDDMISELESHKTISHDYMKLSADDICLIKNYYSLTANTPTTTKLNALEQLDVINNIKLSLANNFNSRKIDYGTELSYDTLIETIEESDSRIKSVPLNEPDLTTKIVKCDGTEYNLYTDDGKATDLYKNIVSKNLLAGRIPLYNYDERFSFDFGQTNSNIYDNVRKISTYANLSTITESGYTLNNNEVIEFIAPELEDDIQYTYGFNYYVSSKVDKDSTYLIGDNMTFVTQYTNSNNNEVVTVYTKGQMKIYTASKGTSSFTSSMITKTINTDIIINPNLDLTAPTGDDVLDAITKTIIVEGTTYKLKTLSTNDTIDVKKFNKTTLNNTYKLYWSLNSVNNSITWNNNEYILSDGEYLFYTDANNTMLYTYGVGTKITRSDSSLLNDTPSKDLNLEDVSSDGINALLTYFITYSFTTTKYITIVKNELITLTGGCTIIPNANLTIENNTFGDELQGITIQYRTSDDGELETLSSRDSMSTGDRWRCRALLDISSGPSNPQILTNNQKLTIYYGDDELSLTQVDITNKYIETDVTTQYNGGENVSLAYIDLSNITEDNTSGTTYPSFYVYENTDTSSILEKQTNNLYKVKFDTSPITINVYSNYDSLIMLYVTGTSSTEKLSLTNLVTPIGTSVTDISSDGMYMFKIQKNTTCFTLNNNGNENISCIISKISPINKLNPLLGIQESDNILSYMSTNYGEAYKQWWINAPVNSSIQIGVSTNYPLNNPLMFFDVNNIANKWTISEIDFSNFHIDIASNSKK